MIFGVFVKKIRFLAILSGSAGTEAPFYNPKNGS
jgi:hypothetical protein